MNKILLIVFGLCLGCGPTERETENHYKFVSSKDIFFYRNSDRFILSFSDNTDAYVSYGIFQYVKIGDTLTFVCEKGTSINKWNCQVKLNNSNK